MYVHTYAERKERKGREKEEAYRLS